MPPAEQVREELEKIIASEVFARSGRARDLLQYIVEQDLAGNADRLKGFAIAIDVFGKPQDFDPANDPLVRVQAGRLRDFLSQYYRGPGADDPIRITIPRGSYAPVYSLADPTDEGRGGGPVDTMLTDDEAGAEPVRTNPVRAAMATGHRKRRLLPLSVLATALLLALGLAVYLDVLPPGEAGMTLAGAGSTAGSAETTGSVPREGLPSVYLDAAAGEASERVETLLRLGISGFDTVNLIARPPGTQAQGTHLRTDFVFTVVDHGEDSVLLEVHHIVSGKVLLSKVMDGGGADMIALEDRLADVLSTIIPVSGVIYAAIVDARAETPLIQCLVLNERFYREQREDAHRAAYECLEGLVASGSTSPLVYSELGALHIQAIHNRYDYPANPSPEKALEFARQAVQYGPGSPYAHRSMGYVLSRTASAEESLRWTEKAYELNTFDLGMAASYGYAKIFAGDYGNGTPILQRAVNAASAHPTWWDYGLFLGHFMNDDMAGAANAVSALAASDRAHYVAARLIAAHALGQNDVALPLLKQIATEHRTFAADPLAFYRQASYPADMCERLAAALHDAGLGGAS